MKKFVFVALSCLFFSMAFSQDTLHVTNGNKVSVQKKAADHFMFQLSSDHWATMPDSIKSHQSGLSRGFNAYVMINKQLKNSPKLSLAIGVGVSTSNIIFKKVDIGVTAAPGTLPFTHLDSVNHFKKYKLSSTFLEIPLELRFTAKPDNPDKSLKAAIGLKAGTLVNLHTKGKNWVDKNGNVLNGYTEKENSKRFFSTSHFMATGRIGYGIFSLFGSYQINGLLKDGAGPSMRLYQVGITVSGL